MNTFDKGNLSLVKCIAALTEAGYRVSVPVGDGGRYDLVADDGDSLLRIQVKTARLRKGVVRFNCYSHARGVTDNYESGVDAYCAYCPDTDETYFVPVEEFNGRECSLRYDGKSHKRIVRRSSEFILGPMV